MYFLLPSFPPSLLPFFPPSLLHFFLPHHFPPPGSPTWSRESCRSPSAAAPTSHPSCQGNWSLSINSHCQDLSLSYSVFHIISHSSDFCVKYCVPYHLCSVISDTDIAFFWACKTLFHTPLIAFLLAVNWIFLNCSWVFQIEQGLSTEKFKREVHLQQ